MKAWNKEATAADLAPEARQTIAHNETVGKTRVGFKPRMGRKKISSIARIGDTHI